MVKKILELDKTALIHPNWLFSSRVTAFTTTRTGGVSESSWAGLNVGPHVGDRESHVCQNRQLVQRYTRAELGVAWANQVHSDVALSVDQPIPMPKQETEWLNPVGTADALYTQLKGQPIAMMTADCLPMLVVDKACAEVAAVHGGWRGLLGGVVENTLQLFKAPMCDLSVWLGPAIGPAAFEVGGEVVELFKEKNPKFLRAVAPARTAEKAFLDIYTIAKVILEECGIAHVCGGHFCTFQEKRFFSYRRSGQTGRMATVISL